MHFQTPLLNFRSDRSKSGMLVAVAVVPYFLATFVHIWSFLALRFQRALFVIAIVERLFATLVKMAVYPSPCIDDHRSCNLVCPSKRRLAAFETVGDDACQFVRSAMLVHYMASCFKEDESKRSTRACSRS